MDKKQKQELVSSLKDSLNQSDFVLVTRQTGLTVSEITELRQKVRQVGASYKVTKNTLSKLALKGSSYEGLSEHFFGPTALVCSSDPIGVAKVISNFSKTNQKLTIVAAQMGNQSLNEKEIKDLAALPSPEELRSGLVCLLKSAASGFVALIQAPASQVVRLTSAYHSKHG